MERLLANQMNLELDLDFLSQPTNHKDYLRLEQVKNAVLYLSFEEMQKGPKKIKLYL